MKLESCHFKLSGYSIQIQPPHDALFDLQVKIIIKEHID